MTDTVERQDTRGGGTGAAGRAHRLGLRLAVAAACGLLGFVLVAQVRATESVGDRLHVERQEDLARILAELSGQSDRLQREVAELRLTLVEFETSAEGEELARRSLEHRLDDLRVLTGVMPVEGEGVILTVEDPDLLVTQDAFVDVVQELRDAGAEAIAVNDIRLVVSSSFTTRNERVLLDRLLLEPPYRMVAIGPATTIATALGIPGGAIDSLHLSAGVTATVETREDLTLPAAGDLPSFVFGQPVDQEAP
jgi:uncharacterized protein YlxW (UPF0749 family)